MLKYLIKRPMLLSGIACCIISVAGFNSKWLLLFILLVSSVFIAFIIFKKADEKLVFTSVLIFIMGISSLLNLKTIDNLSYFAGTAANAEVTVLKENYKYDDYNIATVQVAESEVLPEGTKIIAFYEPMNLQIGQRIKCRLKLREIDERYKKSNYSDGIYLSGNMNDITRLKNKDDIVLKLAEKIKSYIRNTLFNNLRYNEASTVCALVFGEKGYFTDDFYDNVRASGVSHIMVVSGMHLAILVSFFVKLSRKIFYNPVFKAATIIFVVLILTALCGFTMSILRAGITYVIMAIGILLDKKGTPENTLGAAVTVILIFSPFAIFSISFLLSVLSTFGILVIAIPFSDYLEERKFFKNKITREAITSVLFSLSATIMTLPVIISVFKEISMVAIISNLLISPAVTFELSLSVVAIILAAICPFIAEIIFIPVDIITRYINFIITELGGLPYATAKAPEFSVYLAVLLIFLMLIIMLACKSKRNMLKLKEIHYKKLKEGGGKLKWR